MIFPDEEIPPEDTRCTGCGREVQVEHGGTRYLFTRPCGRVRRGVFHTACTPDDMVAWLAKSAALLPGTESNEQ
jgi:hypothetical protein